MEFQSVLLMRKQIHAARNLNRGCQISTDRGVSRKSRADGSHDELWEFLDTLLDCWQRQL